jgi:hypothetical protein
LKLLIDMKSWRDSLVWPGAVVFLALLLASCATVLGPREVEVPLSRLQASLDSRFPLSQRFLELFEIKVASPRLALQGNRLVASMDAAIAPPFMKDSWKGSLSLSGVPAIDASRNAVVLTDTRVEDLHIAGVDPTYSRQVTKAASLLAEQVFRDLVLYRFDPQDFRYAGVSFMPTRINAKADALVVTFEPLK